MDAHDLPGVEPTTASHISVGSDVLLWIVNVLPLEQLITVLRMVEGRDAELRHVLKQLKAPHRIVKRSKFWILIDYLKISFLFYFV